MTPAASGPSRASAPGAHAPVREDDSPAGHGDRFRRRLLALPDPACWRAATGGVLAAALERLAHVDGERLAARLRVAHGATREASSLQPDLLHALGHPLTAQALARSTRLRFDAQRTALEARICARYAKPLRAALTAVDAQDFIGTIEHLGREAGGTSGFRARAVALRGDASDARLRFPHHRHIVPRLAELHGYLRRHRQHDPLFCTLVAMVAITNLHPFLDANGRCSRILGNALLRDANPHHIGYLPFYEVFWHSGHGWEIRVRLAELCADWEPLCTYMGELARVAAPLASATIPQSIA